jgi:hypothetical protein
MGIYIYISFLKSLDLKLSLLTPNSLPITQFTKKQEKWSHKNVSHNSCEHYIILVLSQLCQGYTHKHILYITYISGHHHCLLIATNYYTFSHHMSYIICTLFLFSVHCGLPCLDVFGKDPDSRIRILWNNIEPDLDLDTLRTYL